MKPRYNPTTIYFLSVFGLAVMTLSTLIGQEEGFVSIFDGETLAGWNADTDYWSVRDGAITGETTPADQLLQNTFAVWEGGMTKDFELKLSYRIIGGNSGIQFRSRYQGDPSDRRISGYQADIDSGDRYTGILFEELGRRFLAWRGDVTELRDDGVHLVGSLGTADEIQAQVKKEDWNEYHIIADGPHIRLMINGVPTAAVTDLNEAARSLEGLLAFQLHTGPPMTVQFKDIRIKHLGKGAENPAVAFTPVDVFNDVGGNYFVAQEERDQLMIRADQFEKPILIEGVVLPVFGDELLLEKVTIRLSTAANPIAEMMSVMDENLGKDVVTVYDGPLKTEVSESETIFNVTIPFSTPFLYDPSKGDFLFDWHYFNEKTMGPDLGFYPSPVSKDEAVIAYSEDYTGPAFDQGAVIHGIGIAFQLLVQDAPKDPEEALSDPFVAVTTGPAVEDLGHSVGVSAADYDGDGDFDLLALGLDFVNSEGLPNHLYENQGDGSFVRVVDSAVAQPKANSNAAVWADADNDGDLDLFITNDTDTNNEFYSQASHSGT